MSNENIQVIEEVGTSVFMAQERAAIDTQVATAKQYPRDLRRVLDNSLAIATMNKATAESCRFAKPVSGKQITGPSVHLARIICQQFGNIRVQQRVKSIEAKVVVTEAVAFDMETNYAVCVEVRKSILYRNGSRYPDTMIETTSMAALAIAERNAIFKVIPKSIVDAVFTEAFNMVYGELSDNTKLVKARDNAYKKFKNDYGASEETVNLIAGVKTKTAIKADDIANLIGFINALVARETSIDDLVTLVTPKKNISQKKTDLKDKKNDNPVNEMP